MSTQNVTIYSADWCGFCHTAKAYLDKAGIAYTEKNIETDPAYAEESVKKSGQAGIPVIDIASEIIVGFDRPKIDELLKKHDITA
jgi:glutaredoxin 3